MRGLQLFIVFLKKFSKKKIIKLTGLQNTKNPPRYFTEIKLALFVPVRSIRRTVELHVKRPFILKQLLLLLHGTLYIKGGDFFSAKRLRLHAVSSRVVVTTLLTALVFKDGGSNPSRHIFCFDSNNAQAQTEKRD